MLPCLYSFRRCPYAMRARMAIYASGMRVEIREVSLKAKPEILLTLSPKGTVPVLSFSDGKLLEESLDIIQWAFSQPGQESWGVTDSAKHSPAMKLLEMNDSRFKYYLDRYKYPERYQDSSPSEAMPAMAARKEAEKFLQVLENQLSQHSFLLCHTPSFADVGIFPFIRQFAGVDEEWFSQSPYPRVRTWLEYWLSHPYFAEVMRNLAPWQPGDAPVYFGQMK
jgi:glutathione S-transferase